jgi:hypothetical protein
LNCLNLNGLRKLWLITKAVVAARLFHPLKIKYIPPASTSGYSPFDSSNHRVTNLSIMKICSWKNLLCFWGKAAAPAHDARIHPSAASPYADVVQGPEEPRTADPPPYADVVQGPEEIVQKLVEMEARLSELETPKASDATFALQHQMLTIRVAQECCSSSIRRHHRGVFWLPVRTYSPTSPGRPTCPKGISFYSSW